MVLKESYGALIGASASKGACGQDHPEGITLCLTFGDAARSLPWVPPSEMLLQRLLSREALFGVGTSRARTKAASPSLVYVGHMSVQ